MIHIFKKYRNQQFSFENYEKFYHLKKQSHISKITRCVDFCKFTTLMMKKSHNYYHAIQECDGFGINTVKKTFVEKKDEIMKNVDETVQTTKSYHDFSKLGYYQ